MTKETTTAMDHYKAICAIKQEDNAILVATDDIGNTWPGSPMVKKGDIIHAKFGDSDILYARGCDEVRTWKVSIADKNFHLLAFKAEPMNALNEIEAQAAPNTEVPAWAVEYFTEFTTMDITDNWREETGDDGSNATAYFEENRDTCGDAYQTLLGIKVDDGHGAVFYDAVRATEFLTRQVVIRLESSQTEAMA